MSLFFESIRVIDGEFDLLELHEERMQRARAEELGLIQPLSLRGIPVPENHSKGVVKCRIEYDHGVDRVTFEPYEAPYYDRFRLIRDDDSDYPHKFTDRAHLLGLLEAAAPDGLVIVRDGLITDTYHANLAFYDGTSWYTPATPLLRGCMREWLLRTGQISAAAIRVDDLSRYTHFKQINSMLGFFESALLPIDRIVGF